MTDKQKSALFWLMIISFGTITGFTILGYFTPFVDLPEENKETLFWAIIIEFSIAFFAFLYQAFGVKKPTSKNSVTENSESNTSSPSIDTNMIIENIKDDVRDLFTDRNFIQHYKDDTLFQVTDTLIAEITKRKFNGIEDILTKEIIGILNYKNGFYSQVDIIYDEEILDNGYAQTTTTRVMHGEIKDKILSGSMMVDILDKYTEEEQLFLSGFKVNNKPINIKEINSTYDNDEKLKRKNKRKINFSIDLSKHEKVESIETKIVTIEESTNVHTLSIKRPTKNLSVEYIYNPKQIKNPNFVSKYGETGLLNIEKDAISKDKAYIKYNYGNKVFLPKEFFFIYYERI